jgi:hypothetical protein
MKSALAGHAGPILAGPTHRIVERILQVQKKGVGGSSPLE